MADTGWVFAGTGTTAAGTESAITFNNPGNITADDAAVSNAAGSKFDNTGQPGEGPELIASNFGFNIPPGNGIVGIETRIEGNTDANLVSELAYLNIAGTFKDNEWTNLSASTTIHTYGSPTDIWGTTTLSRDIVNSSSFGWIYMVYDDAAPLNMSVDYMQMKIYYEVIPSAIIVVMGT